MEYQGFDETEQVMEKVSVTELVQRYSTPFNSDFWSTYRALERLLKPEDWKDVRGRLMDTRSFNHRMLKGYGLTEEQLDETKEQILREWEEKRQKSLAAGKAIHAAIEAQFSSIGSKVDCTKYGIGGVLDAEVVAPQNGVLLEGVTAELPVTATFGDVMLTGRIDLVYRKGNEVIIVDHKTGGTIKTKGMYNGKKHGIEKMLFPLNSLDDNSFNRYQMQLSLYAMMLEKVFPEIRVTKLMLNHYSDDGKQEVLPCEYMRDYAFRLVEHVGKAKAKEERAKRFKPFDY